MGEAKGREETALSRVENTVRLETAEVVPLIVESP